MANLPARDSKPMPTAEAVDEDRTLALASSPDALALVCEELARFDTKPPPPELATFDPWAEPATRIVAPVEQHMDEAEPDSLDGAALFADLRLIVPPPPADVSLMGIYGTATNHPLAASIEQARVAPVVTEYAPVARSRDVATVRSKRPSALHAIDPRKNRLAAIVVCASLALVAALGACIVYVGAPLRGQATVTTHGPN
jgi:hypothetical protein